MFCTIAHEYERVEFLQSHKKFCTFAHGNGRDRNFTQVRMFRTLAHENERGLKTHSKKPWMQCVVHQMAQIPSKTVKKPSNFYEKVDKLSKKTTKFKPKNRQVWAKKSLTQKQGKALKNLGFERTMGNEARARGSVRTAWSPWKHWSKRFLRRLTR